MTEAGIYKELKLYFSKRWPEGSYTMWKSPSFKNMRWDIFGIYDVIVAFSDHTPMFIQFTSVSNLSARRNKIRTFQRYHHVLIPNSFIFAWDERKSNFLIEDVN